MVGGVADHYEDRSRDHDVFIHRIKSNLPKNPTESSRLRRAPLRICPVTTVELAPSSADMTDSTFRLKYGSSSVDDEKEEGTPASPEAPLT